MSVALPPDVKPISWAAKRLAISTTTAYRLAEVGRLPGVFKVGAQWRVSVPRFEQEVHGSALEGWLRSLAQGSVEVEP
jgi:excisionase family DNA binding protein